MMYQVIIIDNNWKYITDGQNIYEANHDIRHNSDTPRIDEYNFNFLSGLDDSSYLIRRLEAFGSIASKYNQITKISFDFKMLEKIISGTDYKIKNSINSLDKILILLEYTLYIYLAALIIAFFNNVSFIKASILGLILGIFVAIFRISNSDFNDLNLARLFNNSVESSKKWNIFQEQFYSSADQTRVNYLKKAKNQWNKYFKLKNILSSNTVQKIDQLSGFEFEMLLKEIYVEEGYKVDLTKKSSDYGVDLIARKNNEILAIQAKRYTSTVGKSAIDEVYSGSKFYNATNSAVITTSSFSKNAIILAKKLNINLIDRQKLVQKIYSLKIIEKSIPEFDIQKYEIMKYDISKFLKNN